MGCCGGLTVATPQPIAPTGNNRPTRDVVLQATAFKSYVPTYQRTKREFQLATDPDFTSLVFTASPSSDQVTVNVRLSKATTYYWRCRDFTEVSGVTSPWSQMATFTTIPDYLYRNPPVRKSRKSSKTGQKDNK